MRVTVLVVMADVPYNYNYNHFQSLTISNDEIFSHGQASQGGGLFLLNISKYF